MEHLNNAQRMLALLDRPAFMAAQDKVIHVNPSAAALCIQKDTTLTPLLGDSKGIYEDFTHGLLQMTIWLQGKPIGATVEKLDGFDLFLLDYPQQDKQLEALATASAQLRFPLTGLMNAMDENTPNTNRMIYQLHRAVSNMSDAYRYSANRTAQMQVFEICSWLDQLTQSVAAHAESLGIQVQYKPLSTPVYCPIDEELLQRAILNLISNSIKAGSTHLELSLSKQLRTLSITLTDNGTGVPQDLRSDMFCRYQQAPSAQNWSYGMGLGMVIVKAAAQTHKGAVLLEHRAEGGLRTTLTISTAHTETLLRSPIMRIDYLGGGDPILTELSDVLPISKY